MSIFVPTDRGSQPPRQIVRAWVRRFNAADANGLAVLYHKDGVASLPGGAPVRGQRRIRSMFETRFRQGTSPRFAETVYGIDCRVVLEWRDLDGNCGSEFFTVDSGRILSSGARPEAAERPSSFRRLLSAFS